MTRIRSIRFRYWHELQAVHENRAGWRAAPGAFFFREPLLIHDVFHTRVCRKKSTSDGSK